MPMLKQNLGEHQKLQDDQGIIVEDCKGSLSVKYLTTYFGHFFAEENVSYILEHPRCPAGNKTKITKLKPRRLF